MSLHSDFYVFVFFLFIYFDIVHTIKLFSSSSPTDLAKISMFIDILYKLGYPDINELLLSALGRGMRSHERAE